MKTFPLLLLFVLIGSGLFAQKGADEAIKAFTGTEFMVKFRELRERSQNAVTEFKQIQHNYPEEDVTRVRQAYDRTATKFNDLLESIKADFLDKKKMKYITEYPDSYSKGLELELYKLSDYYSQNFQQTIREVTGDQIDGTPMILLITEIIGLTKEVVDYMVRLKRAAKQLNAESIESKLIQPNRFKAWHEIAGSSRQTQQEEPNNEQPNPNPNNGEVEEY
jgi:hypothetical protein